MIHQERCWSLMAPWALTRFSWKGKPPSSTFHSAAHLVLRGSKRLVASTANHKNDKQNLMSAKVKWNFEADYIQACNCDYGCPCEFSAPPTKGFCDGMGGWQIHQGTYGDVNLAGLALGFAAHWPKAIHEGNGTVCLFIDERANQKQREALLKIGSGEAGGLPFEILATTFSTLLDPQFLPFHFTLNGLKSGFKVGAALSASLGPI